MLVIGRPLKSLHLFQKYSRKITLIPKKTLGDGTKYFEPTDRAELAIQTW